MERFLLGDLMLLRDAVEVGPTTIGESSGLRMAGVDLRSLATFDLGGHACRSGLAEAGEVVAVSGQPAPAALSAPVDVVLAGTPVSVWRVPDWQVGDWTVVHLVLVARDGSEMPLAVHRELTGVLEIERDGASRVPLGGGTFGGDRVVQCTAEVPGGWSRLEVSLQPLTRGGSLSDAVRL